MTTKSIKVKVVCNYVSNEGTQFDNEDDGSSVQCNYVLNVGHIA